MIFILVAAFAFQDQAGAGAAPSPADIVRILQSDSQRFSDVSMVYEGATRYVGPARLSPKKPEVFASHYNGLYLYRNDGAVLCDIYRRREIPESPMVRERFAYLGGQLGETVLSPELRHVPLDTKSNTTAPSTLDRTGVPNRFLYLWFLNWASGMSTTQFRSDGFEQVDGSMCLVISVDVYPQFAREYTMVAKLWLDVARDGHPLRIEWTKGGKLLLRTHSIRLEQFTLPGGVHYWFPIQGVTDSFLWGQEYLDQPALREEYNVVRGTLKFNQGLKDAAFSLQSDQKALWGAQSDALQKYFDSLVAKLHTEAEPRDPESIQKRLVLQLEEAKRQSQLLEASSATRESWFEANILQIVALGLGVTALIAALFFLKRGGA
jgi:hypothetical protein